MFRSSSGRAERVVPVVTSRMRRSPWIDWRLTSAIRSLIDPLGLQRRGGVLEAHADRLRREATDAELPRSALAERDVEEQPPVRTHSRPGDVRAVVEELPRASVDHALSEELVRSCRGSTRSRASCRRARADRAGRRPHPQSGAWASRGRHRPRCRPTHARDGASRPARVGRPSSDVRSARLSLPLPVAPLDPSAADDVPQMVLAPRALQLALRHVGSLLVHPSPELASSAVHPLDERLDLLGVGGALARVARIDDRGRPCPSPTQCCASRPSSRSASVSSLSSTSGAGRMPSASSCSGVSGTGRGSIAGAIQLPLEVFERARRLLLEGRGPVDHDDLGRLEAASEQHEREDGESEDRFMAFPSARAHRAWARASCRRWVPSEFRGARRCE